MKGRQIRTANPPVDVDLLTSYLVSCILVRKWRFELGTVRTHICQSRTASHSRCWRQPYTELQHDSY